MPYFFLFLAIIIILYYIFKNQSPSNEIIKSKRIDEMNKSKTIDEMNKSVDNLVSLSLEENRSNIEFLISRDIKVLKNKYERLIFSDEFGDENIGDWLKFEDKYINKKLLTFKLKSSFDTIEKFDNKYSEDILTDNARQIMHDKINDKVTEGLINILDKVLQKEIRVSLAGNTYSKESLKDPILFEKAVAKNFKEYEWNTSDTNRTGDQGADVIAMKDDIKCIVQCKLYTKPVGNKAVQEVFSAKNYYNGDLAMVVSNADFTKSARQLADSNNVALLHYSYLSDYLEEFDEKF